MQQLPVERLRNIGATLSKRLASIDVRTRKDLEKVGPVRAYRLLFSPWVGFNCRYQPTCSAYALEALEKHGAIKGTWLAARRIGRCHPWGGDGYDPVPDKEDL